MELSASRELRVELQNSGHSSAGDLLFSECILLGQLNRSFSFVMELFDNTQMFLFQVDINLNMQPLQNFERQRS